MRARLQRYCDSLLPLGAVESFSACRLSTTDGLSTRDYDAVAGDRKLRLHRMFLPDGTLEGASISDPRQP